MSKDVFADRLLPGERLLWSGDPGQGVRFTAADLWMIPFGLLWTSFTVFWEGGVLSTPAAPWIMKLWGIPFVLLGLYVLVGRFFVDAWIRRGMRYAVTNRRILVWRAAPSAKLTVLGLDQLPEISLSERPDGRGSIRFGGSQVAARQRNGFAMWTPALDPVPQFIDILEARSVFDQIQRAAQAVTRRPAG